MITNDANFRRDVDVLRGLAVMLVVLYHLDLSLFRSGFIGVDIFFVLSGYLIGSIYSREQNAKNFYERRFRRIMPAMLVVLFIFLCVAPILFLPFEVRTMTDSVLGTLLFVPNLVFWRDNDYFSNLSFSPLLHYWSLGVELQYYLIFPLLFWCSRKFKYFFPLLALLSLAGCIVITEISSKSAFFLLPTRLWEFFFGYFAYQLKDLNLISKIKGYKFSSECSLLLLLSLIIMCMLPIPSDQFPGVYALIPVVVCFIFIVVGINNERYLNSVVVRIVRWLAKISFSIYLIHFPVIFIFKYAPFSEIVEMGALQKIMAIIITLFLASISYRYIESPMRNRNVLPLKYFLLIVVVMYISVISIIYILKANDYFGRLYGEQKYSIFRAMDDRGGWRCSKLQKLQELNANSCYLKRVNHAEKTIYLVGDSHMDVLKGAFVDAADNRNISIRLNRTRCLLGKDECSFEQIIVEVQKYNITDIVLHGYPVASFKYDNIGKLAEWVAEHGVRLHFIGPVPKYNKSIPSGLYEEVLTGKEVIRRQDLGGFTANLPVEYLNFKNNFNGYKNLYFYMPENILCNEICRLSSVQGVFYFDSNHLTLTGANELNPLVEEIYSK